MAGEVISHVDFVIDADGFRRTGELLGTMDKYMERIQRRAEALSRLTIMPKIRLNDCLCEPLRQIRMKLDSLTKSNWIVPLVGRFYLDTSVIDSAGLAAGKAFSVKFLESFNTNVADKLKKLLAEAGGNMSDDSSGDGGKKKWWEMVLPRALDFGLDVLSGTISGYLSNKIIERGTRNRSSSSSDKRNNASETTTKTQKPKSEMKKSKVRNSATGRPNPGVHSQTAATLPATKPGKGKGIISFGKNIWNRIRGSNNANLSFSSSAHPMGMDLASHGSSNIMAKTALKTGSKLFRPLSVISDIASIASAKPGKKRQKAVGGALGGWGGAAAGAAIGSVVPIVGTVIGGAIGGMAGSFAGEWIGANASKMVDTVKDLGKKAWGGLFGSGKKKTAPPVPAQPTPSEFEANFGQATAGASPPPNSVDIHVNIPVGAVQLKVKEKLNYDELSAIIGSKIAVSIQQAMENRV